MKASVLLLAASATFTLSAPASTSLQRDTLTWSPSLAEFYYRVDEHIRDARAAPSFPSPPACDLSLADMPVAPTPLPAPDAGLVLSHVAIGRGVQNYTCSNSTLDALPASIGAIANLYNVSCIAPAYPDLLALLPDLALQVPYPSQYLPTSKIDLSGFHYFATNTTPVFNLDADPDSKLGITFGKKNANSTAPANAIKGVNGVGDGAVAWLKIVATNATIGGVRNVFRLNTAGGSPPKTCQGLPPSFSVQYAAEYWFWADS